MKKKIKKKKKKKNSSINPSLYIFQKLHPHATLRICDLSFYLDPKEVQLVMIGQSKAGKTKAANSILGGDIFDFSKETSGCVSAKRKVNDGRSVIVTDTTGFFNKPRESRDSLINDLKDTVHNLSAKSRIFVLVIRMDRQKFTDDGDHFKLENAEKEIIDVIEKQFQDKIAK